MTPSEFIAKWRHARLTERSAAQQRFLDLCALLGHPTPAAADPTGESFTFERGAEKLGGGNGWASKVRHPAGFEAANPRNKWKYAQIASPNRYRTVGVDPSTYQHKSFNGHTGCDTGFPYTALEFDPDWAVYPAGDSPAAAGSQPDAPQGAAPVATGSHRRTWRWFAGLAVAATLVGALIVVRGARPRGYRLLVSPPLPGGSRYALLYPAYLDTVRWDGVEASIRGRGHTLEPDRRTEWLTRLGAPPRGESLTVVVRASLAHQPPGPRSDERWERGGHLRHNVHARIQGTALSAMLYHGALSRSALPSSGATG